VVAVVAVAVVVVAAVAVAAAAGDKCLPSKIAGVI
jgi:hypothetical protein